MNKDKTGFFESSPGNFSMNRLLTFMVAVAGISWGTYGVIMSSFNPDTVIHKDFVLYVLSLALGGKVAQKFVEGYNNNKINKNED